MRYFEAMSFARMGQTVGRSGKIVRFLTPEEAKPILLDRMPRRRVKVDEKGQPIVNLVTKKIEIEVYAPDDIPPERLGLFDVSVKPPIEYRPSDQDVGEEDWEVIL